MIPLLFVGIAVMFLFLACGSRYLESHLKRPHSKIIEVIEREITHEDEGASGYASATSYLYKTVKWHYRLEILGFLVAAIAAIAEYLLAIGR
jgi:hypothetical protein